MNTTASIAKPRLRELHELPGPRCIPLLGNLHQVHPAQIHRDVEAWCRRYGPLFRLKLGIANMLVVSDHETLNAVLRDRPEGFRRTPVVAELAKEMHLPAGVFSANGDAWRVQRRMVMAGLDPRHVKSYFPLLLRVTQRLRGRWQRAAQAGTAIELQPELMRYTVDGVAGLAFGKDINTIESDEEVIQRHLDKIFPMLFKRILSYIPWWRLYRTRADRALEKSVVAVNDIIRGFIAEARQRLAADAERRTDPPNLLEAMIVAADAEDSGITDEEVAGNVLTMLLAGEDTTANTLAWMIHLLHRHPAILQRVQQEVRTHAPDVAQFTLEQLAQLRYLDACIHETMRLKPVAPFQVVEAIHDTVVADVRIPAGTGVWCLMRGDSMSERYFDAPESFDPARWLAQSGNNADTNAKRISMPFGAGPRICPGRYLALLEIKMAMAMLLAHFEIAEVTTPDGHEAREHMAFTMMPVGLRMRLSAPR